MKLTGQSFLVIGLGLCLTIGGFSAPRAYAEIPQPIMSPNCNVFTFDATGSADPENEKISYSWDFGDGNTAIGPVVDHRYEKSGEYFVNLKITDNSGSECAEDSVSQKVVVNIPPYVEFSAPSRVCANTPVVMDASNSHDDADQPLSYYWNFGDGTHLTTPKSSIQKIFEAGGTYEISLTVDDNLRSICNTAMDSRMIYVNEPPKIGAGPKNVFRCVQREADLTVEFDASDTYDINADELSYTWDMGDGRTKEGVQITHAYPGSGLYDIKLLVSDNSHLECSSDVALYKLRLSKAPQANAGTDILACIGEEIDFDGRRSTAELKGSLAGTWAFGNGQTASGLKLAYAYPKAGQYQATLTVEDKLNAMCPPSSDTKNIVINAPPTVSITAASSGCVGDTLEFRATSAFDPDGDDLEYYWTFGDGTIKQGDSVVSHTYERGGDYRVTVIVDDGRATACSTASAEARVKVNTPPVADAGPNLTCCLGENAEFNATASSDADDDPLLYTWTFGDGVVKEGSRVAHRYAQSGSYTVVLTVDDNSRTHCSTSTATFIAEVNAKPTATFNVR